MALRRGVPIGTGLERTLASLRSPSAPLPIPEPPSDPALIEADWNSFTLESFTADDAVELGHLLYARLRSFAPERPALISIALANQRVLFQVVTGPGLMPDHERWVQRKRNTVLRFGVSSWLMGRRFNGDSSAFGAKYGLSNEEAAEYAIHGGGVPIYVRGVDGVVGVVLVSGLKQHEDHGVIVSTIKENWVDAAAAP